MGAYYIPEEFRNKEEHFFLFSYINRTKKNLEYIETKAAEEKQDGLKSNACTVFETTELLNSLMGIIVFPMESFLETTIGDRNRNPSATIDSIINGILSHKAEHHYNNTYKQYDSQKGGYTDKPEKLTRYRLIKHMRDAMCHEKLSIVPLPKEGEDIEFITFEDDYSNGSIECQFSVKLSVSEIRTLALAICKLLLDVAKLNYNFDFEGNN